MSRNDRKTWTLTDLKLNYWRAIHERQTKKKLPTNDTKQPKSSPPAKEKHT